MKDQYKVRTNADSYGFAIGILLIDCSTPFIPGDVGNASTYNYPVLYKTVAGVTLERLINQGDESLIDNIIEAAKYLENMGVKAITSDCGYMVRYQKKVADAVNIPVILSSLVQLPMLELSMGNQQKIGIICANKQRLTHNLLGIAGLRDTDNVVVYGLEDQPNFRDPILDETGTLEPHKIEKEIVDTALKMLEKHPEIGPILLECSNLPPYASAVQQATGRLVFDYTSLIDNYFNAATRKPFSGLY
jgi:aspartate/glutamate racemase